MVDQYPIFTLKTSDHSDEVKIKYIRTTTDPESVKGSLIDIDTTDEMKEKVGKNSYFITKIGEYDIFARFYNCSILGNYLLTFDKWPVLYMTVIYERKFLTGKLFDLYLSFTIDNEEKKEITQPSNYVNRTVRGKFSLDFLNEDGFIDRIKKSLNEQIGEYIINKYVENKITNIDITEANNYKNSLIEKSLEILKPREIVFTSKKHIIEHDMFDICEQLKPVIYTGIHIRDSDRSEGTQNDFDIPTSVINVKDLTDDFSKIDDLF